MNRIVRPWMSLANLNARLHVPYCFEFQNVCHRQIASNNISSFSTLNQSEAAINYHLVPYIINSQLSLCQNRTISSCDLVHGRIVSTLNLSNNTKSFREISKLIFYEKRYSKHEQSRKSQYGRLKILIGLLGVFGFGDGSDDGVRKKSKNKLSKLDTLIAKAVLKMDSQEYDQAVIYLHQALSLAQSEGDLKSELLILNLLAEDYTENGDLERAEAVYTDIMQRMLADGSSQPTDSAILELSLRLASIYSQLPDKLSRAIQGYAYIIDNLTDRLKDFIDKLDTLQMNELTKEVRNDLALLGWTYDWKAKLHISRNEFSEAANILKKALDISMVVLGRNHQQTLILYNDLGTALAMDNRPDEGCEYIRKAVDGAVESNSDEVASFYANLGLVYLQMLKLAEASQYCQRSYELAQSNKSHHSSLNVIELSRNCLDEIKKIIDRR